MPKRLSRAKRDTRTYPNFIRAWRRLRGITQETLCELTGLSVPLISQIERGESGYSRESLTKLARALQVEPGWLLSRDPNHDGDAWAWGDRIAELPPETREQVERVLEALITSRSSQETG